MKFKQSYCLTVILRQQKYNKFYLLWEYKEQITLLKKILEMK